MGRVNSSLEPETFGESLARKVGLHPSYSPLVATHVGLTELFETLWLSNSLASKLGFSPVLTTTQAATPTHHGDPADFNHLVTMVSDPSGTWFFFVDVSIAHDQPSNTAGLPCRPLVRHGRPSVSTLLVSTELTACITSPTKHFELLYTGLQLN